MRSLSNVIGTETTYIGFVHPLIVWAASAHSSSLPHISRQSKTKRHEDIVWVNRFLVTPEDLKYVIKFAYITVVVAYASEYHPISVLQ